MFSPIALFTYNRPWHTQQTIEALLDNAEASRSDLIIFSDGAKGDNDANSVVEVRRYLHSIRGFKSIRIIEREQNIGLAASIISGVTEIVNEYGRIIVLEDDLVTSPYFLSYMNNALNLYKEDDRVISIHGFNFPIVGTLPNAFFMKGASCLGWATWKWGWEVFESDGSKLLNELTKKNILDRFNLFGAYNYSGLLRDQIAGKNQSWAVRWYASALLQNKLTLHPGKTLVQHIGSDGSGTHCGGNDTERFGATVSSLPLENLEDISVKENEEVLEAISHFLMRLKPSLWKRIVRKVIRTLFAH